MLESLKPLISHILLLSKRLILSWAQFKHTQNTFLMFKPVSYIPMGQAIVGGLFVGGEYESVCWVVCW